MAIFAAFQISCRWCCSLHQQIALNAVKRSDLGVTDEEFETVWVEIKNIKSKSILGCCAYRHPSSSPERFTEHAY